MPDLNEPQHRRPYTPFFTMVLFLGSQYGLSTHFPSSSGVQKISLFLFVCFALQYSCLKSAGISGLCEPWHWDLCLFLFLESSRAVVIPCWCAFGLNTWWGLVLGLLETALYSAGESNLPEHHGTICKKALEMFIAFETRTL